MPLFVMTGMDCSRGLEIRKETRPAHLAWIQSLGDRVKLGGPIASELTEQPAGSIIFLEATDLAEAKHIYSQDPYRDAGLWDRIDIRAFTVVAGGFKE